MYEVSNPSPRQYPAMHPEKRSRALLLIVMVALTAWAVIMMWTWQPGADTPANSPDIMTEAEHG